MKVKERVKPILVVEDEAIMRESLQDWLANSGYQVETAQEEAEALKIIGKRDFSLLILDLKETRLNLHPCPLHSWLAQ